MIAGNTTALLQIKNGFTKNAIGEKIPDWEDVQQITGWLDFMSGEAGRTNYNAMIEETTHVFISDYVRLDSRVKSSNSRMIINGERYEVRMIDDPMQMHKQLEIFLKYTGGQNE